MPLDLMWLSGTEERTGVYLIWGEAIIGLLTGITTIVVKMEVHTARIIPATNFLCNVYI